MTKTWAYPKRWTPRSSSELASLMPKENKEINAKDGQRHSRNSRGELWVLLFLYCKPVN